MHLFETALDGKNLWLSVDNIEKKNYINIVYTVFNSFVSWSSRRPSIFYSSFTIIQIKLTEHTLYINTYK